MVIRSESRQSPCDPPADESAHLGNGNVKVIRSHEDDLTELLDVARSKPVLAVDAEWNMPDDFSLDSGPPLLQIGLADGSTFFIRNCKMDWRLPQAIVDVLLDPTVLKVGVGIIKDFSFFPQLRGGAQDPKGAGLVELMRVGVAVRSDLMHDSLAYIVKAFTGLVMKTKVNREERHAFLNACDWEAEELTQETIDYASSDVIMTIELTKALTREKLNLAPEVEVTDKVVGGQTHVHEAFQEFVGLKYKRSMLNRACTKCKGERATDHLVVPSDYYACAKIFLEGKKSNRKSPEALLCRDCGALWKKKTGEFRDVIIEEFEAPLGDQDGIKEILDPEKKREADVRKAAFTLWDEHSLKHVSPKRFAQCVLMVEDFLGTTDITEKGLMSVINLKYTVANGEYHKHAKKVLASFKTIEEFEAFEDRWMEYFEKAMEARVVVIEE